MGRERKSVLQSKVAHRILVLFVLSAVIPVGALAAVVLTKGSSRLRDDGVSRLQHACKQKGMAAFQRLQFLDAELRMAIESGAKELGGAAGSGPHTRLLDVAWIGPSASTHALFGGSGFPPDLTADQHEHLAQGKPLLLTDPAASTSRATYLVRAVDPSDTNSTTVWVKLSVDDLLEFESLVRERKLAVLDASGDPMLASIPVPATLTDAARPGAAGASLGVFQCEVGNEEYVGAFWTLFLKVEFGTPGLSIVLSEPQALMEAPIHDFEQALMLSIILSIAVVTLLSITLIRRTLGPISVLQAGTRRLIAHDFDHRVEVRSDDEFRELAQSFNTMAESMGHHIESLESMGEVQRAILASLDESGIAASFLTRVPALVECKSAGVLLVHADGGGAESYVLDYERKPRLRSGRLAPSLLDALGPDVESLLVESPFSDFQLLETFATDGVDQLVLLPIHVDGHLAAVVVLGTSAGHEPPADDIARLRNLSGQVTVALANARLVTQLESLNWGALSALARAIDAKSPWTRGHSDRVMRLACRMGEFLGLGGDELHTLRRGALLHDVGKIGSPAEILEKPDRLTDEEFEIMKQHVELGLRILEPVPAFEDILPIVLEHHERCDGSGYPAGKSGEAIDPLARIVAVADCFDALRSDRPYRKGLAVPKALDIIRGEAGTLLDEDAVAALVRVVETDPDVLLDRRVSHLMDLEPEGVPS